MCINIRFVDQKLYSLTNVLDNKIDKPTTMMENGPLKAPIRKDHLNLKLRKEEIEVMGGASIMIEVDHNVGLDQTVDINS